MERTKNILFELQKLNMKKNVKILEIGCNAGKNLEFLRRNGYTNLTGIDINKHAFDYMKKVYPSLHKMMDKKIGQVEIVLPDIGYEK